MIATISRTEFHVTVSSGLGGKKRFGFKYAFHMTVCLVGDLGGFFFFFFLWCLNKPKVSP